MGSVSPDRRVRRPLGEDSNLAADPMEDESRWADLAPREETRDLARTARDHFRSLQPEIAVRSQLAGEPAADQWQRWVDAGYLDIGMPEEVDGVGDALDVAILLEEAGRALVGDGLLAASMAAQLQVAGGLGPHDLHLGRGASGAAVGRLVDGRASSAPIHILDARRATTYTVLLRDGGSAHVAVVAADTSGVVLRDHRRNHDPSRQLSTVRLDDVPVLAARTTESATGEAALSVSRLAAAADMVGLADAALRQGIDHVTQRHQFGRPLGSFQALKHQIASSYVEVEKARSLVQGAALRVAEGRQDVRTHQLALMGCATATDAALRAAALLIQLMGAMGVTFEADAHLYFRRAHQTALALDPPRAAFRAAALLERRV